MQPIVHSTLSKPIYDIIKNMILAGDLEPGEKIIQEKLASQLGVSRTPLLRALQMLENDFLVESIPRRGMFVRNISVEEMIDVYYCRESIECMATQLAAQRASEEDIMGLKEIFTPFLSNKKKIDADVYGKADETFHNEIIKLSQNLPLERMSRISQIQSKVYSLGLLRTPEETLDEHMKILNALIDKNADLAEQEMRNHIRLSRKVLENYSKK